MTRDTLKEALQSTNQFIRLRDGALFCIHRVYANSNYDHLVEYSKLDPLTLQPGRKRTIDLISFCRKYEPWK